MSRNRPTSASPGDAKPREGETAVLTASTSIANETKAFTGDLFVVAGEQPQPLYNAENITIAPSGRLFATGSTGIFEITLQSQETRNKELGISTVEARWRPVAVDLPWARKPFFSNGIAADEDFLYVACATVAQERNPMTAWCPPLPRIEQSVVGSLGLFAAIKLCTCTSWIVRAKLDGPSLVFDQALQLPGDCFANGIGIDEARRCLFVAWSASKKIIQVQVDKDGMTMGQVLVFVDIVGSPNGIKVHGKELYFTTVEMLSFPSTGCVYGLHSPARPPVGKSAASCKVEAQLIYRRHAFFDDFDRIDTGFVVSAPSDYMDMADYLPPYTGSLRFLENGGGCLGYYRHPLLRHPSAVCVVRNEGAPGTSPGDILITEKHAHTLFLFRPEPALREWLIQ
jgi:hypothetical protein